MRPGGSARRRRRCHGPGSQRPARCFPSLPLTTDILWKSLQAAQIASCHARDLARSPDVLSVRGCDSNPPGRPMDSRAAPRAGTQRTHRAKNQPGNLVDTQLSNEKLLKIFYGVVYDRKVPGQVRSSADSHLYTYVPGGILTCAPGQQPGLCCILG
ncbi:hypothetical protein Bbelb_202670 [Branchiostoma belcheri]|nr:hypothetical protein Bbelb_202670 [Branchiostoma belcheri]